MKKQLVVIAFLVLSAGNVLSDETPEDVVNISMSLMIAGKTAEAEATYIVSNERQRQSVQTRIEQGFKEMASCEISIRALRTFTKDDCAIVAVELLSTKISLNDVDCCCMIRGPQGWRLLPDFPTYSGSLNEISDVQKKVFETLWPQAQEFRKIEKEARRSLQMKNIAPPTGTEPQPKPER